MFLSKKVEIFRRLSLKYGFFQIFVINLLALIQDGGNQLDLALNWKNMATSDFHTEKRSNLKRFIEGDVDLSNKRLKMCEETGHFYEVRSEKNVGFFERNGINFWRSSYRSDRLNHYGDSNGRNRCVKRRIDSKRKDKKEEGGKKEKTDEIEEFLDSQPDAF